MRKIAILQSVSSHTLIFATAVFVALFANVAFFADALRIYGASANLMFVGSLFPFVTAIFVLVLSAVCHRATVKPVLITFLMLSSVIAYFSIKYGTVFDYQMLSNVLATDTAEAGDLLNVELIPYILALGIVPSLAVYFATLKHPHWKTETIDRLKLVGVAGLTLAALQLCFGGHYAALAREHRALLAKVNPTYALYSAAKLAVQSASTPVASERVIVGNDAAVPHADPDRELVVMVVGEAARADHWSLNGYHKLTNPLLAQEDVVNFPDFWSCGTSTAWSVPCMFSKLGREKFDPTTASGQDNALDVLSRAGVSVLWRDNNSSSKGVALRVPYADFKTPSNNTMCDEVECRDEGMLQGLQNFIDTQKGDILIVLHQMGNHGPAYYKRYPKSFERFVPVCRTNDLGSCSKEEISNAYDNAILYTDHFLSKVIGLLKSNDSKFETAMFYVSDHGESLGEYGLYLHGMPYALAPDSQKHVPALMWFGQYKKHDISLNFLDERRQRKWSHDNVFATLLGLFEIDSEAYEKNMDLLVHNNDETANSK